MNNRQIKFRAWDSKNKKFPFIGFHIIGECTAFDLINQYRLEELDDLVVQQFTGIQDSNGADIYEGDIVCALSSDNKYLSTVEWDNCCARWGFKAIKRNGMTFNYNLSAGCSRWKIVGNIFENPELL